MGEPDASHISVCSMVFVAGCPMICSFNNERRHFLFSPGDFGPSCFHLLRMCTGITSLVLNKSHIYSTAPIACTYGCICGQPPNWIADKLLLSSLKEVEAHGLMRSEHEVAFVEQLFEWALALNKMTVAFNYCVTESSAKEMCWMLQSFYGPKICMKFYLGEFLKRS